MWDVRGSVLGTVAACALAASGCGLTLDADPPGRQDDVDAGFDGGGTDAAPPPDAGGGDAATDAARDAGPSCVADEDCDDGNPCTDDTCRSGRCTREPNTARCDDGVYCNGPDRCADGACTDHLGDPCADPTVCDEEKDMCVGCVTDSDCPGTMRGPWSPCDYSGVCDEEAARTRDVRTYSCVSGECVASTTTETEACTRTREGTTCGAPTDCSSDGCEWATECAESGTETVHCAVPVCSGGECSGTEPASMTETCMRDTELQPCGGTDDNLCDGVDVCMGGACTHTATP
ncbi:MAG: hypothetical protein ACOCUS_07265, partial [Polyangiales bacterium]